MELSNAIRLTHEGVLISPIWFRLVAVKPLVLDWCKLAITICRWHDRFGEEPMRLGATKVRIPVVIRRTDGTDKGVISISGSVIVFLLVRGAPDRIKDMLTLRRWLRSEVRPNGAAMGPHDWLVVFRTPLGRRRQRPSRGDGFEGNASQFCVPCIADRSLGEIFLTQWTILIQIDIQNFFVALFHGSLLCGVFSSAFLKSNEHWCRRQDDRTSFATMGGFGGSTEKFVERLLDY
jgi:hypothetical protein